MTALGELFIAAGGAEGKATPPSSFSAATSIGELAIPVLTADGKTILMNVTPSGNAEAGFPALTADGKAVLVEGIFKYLYWSPGWSDVFSGLIPVDHGAVSIAFDSPWNPTLTQFAVPDSWYLISPRQLDAGGMAYYFYGSWIDLNPFTATADLTVSLGLQLQYEDDSTSIPNLFLLREGDVFSASAPAYPFFGGPPYTAGLAFDVGPGTPYAGRPFFDRVRAPRSSTEQEKKIKAMRLNASIVGSISGPHNPPYNPAFTFAIQRTGSFYFQYDSKTAPTIEAMLA